MDNSWIPQSRAERLIATGRVVLAVGSLLAVYLDPLEPARHVAFTYTLLVLYVVYSFLVAIYAAFAEGVSRRHQLLSHAGDMLFFATINYLTEGPTSPFFTFFVFAVVCASLRFGVKGTLATSAFCLLAFLFTGSLVALTAGAAFELNRFIIRSTYLTVVASLLVYVSAYQQRMQRDLSAIAVWPRSTKTRRDELMNELLNKAASVMRSKRVVLTFEGGASAERRAWIGSSSDERFVAAELPVDTLAELFEEAGETTFATRRAASGRAVTIRDARAMRRSEGAGIPPRIAEELRITSVVAASFHGEFVRGRVLFLDRDGDALQEEVAMAKITASLIAGALDAFYAMQQLQKGAVAEERVRVGRDLHDSLLQSLTGVAFQLKTIPKLMERDRALAAARLQEIEGIIAADQRELRWFIDQLQPERTRRITASLEDLDQRLSSLAARFEQQWDLTIDYSLDPIVHLLSPFMRYEIYTLTSEAVANAAKHAAPSHVSVSIEVLSDTAVSINVSDNGRGFSFRGRYDLEALLAMRSGPVTLKERVSSLGGDLVIESTPSGSRIAIRIPIDNRRTG